VLRKHPRPPRRSSDRPSENSLRFRGRVRPNKSTTPLGRAARAAVLAVSLIVIGVVVVPLALGSNDGTSLRGGARNPTNNTGLSYSAETQIISSNSSFGTRQSNKGTGGGAIYGCRSASGGNPCIEANNLNSGSAFEFISSGKTGGSIILSNKSGAPLTTNATGVATGFNANYLEGHQAKEFIPATQASSFAQTSQLLFAVVSQTGALGATRGATGASQTGEKTYTVTFNTSLAKCSVTASPVGPALTTGSLGVAVSTTNANIAEITAPSALAQGFNVQVIC
jgi:hypothetical protein